MCEAQGLNCGTTGRAARGVDRAWSKGYDRDRAWSKECEGVRTGVRGVRGAGLGARGVRGTGLEQGARIEEIAPKYMILHAMAFQMQSAPIDLPFKACLLKISTAKPAMNYKQFPQKVA